MPELRVNPTRMEMKKLIVKYNTARRGHKLLKDKRDELMKRFLDVVREDKELRPHVERALEKYYNGFTAASAVSAPVMLEEALLCQKRQTELLVDYKNIMSVTVPCFDVSTTSAADGTLTYGMAFTSGELDASIAELSSLLEALLRMAELEKTAQLLAEEIEKTRRRVNALEYIMIPQYLDTIKAIKMKLDENERGNTTRLIKVKDMLLKEQLTYDTCVNEEQ